jgi:hypothetical protein
MKQFILLSFFVISVTTQLFSQCTYQRKQLKDLSSTERTELRNLIMDFVKDGTISTNLGPAKYPNVFHHTTHIKQIHFTNNKNFIQWHRYYLQTLEQWLILKGKSKYVPLPSWRPTDCIPDEFWGTSAILPAVDSFPPLINKCITPPSVTKYSDANKCTLFPTLDKFSDSLERVYHNAVHKSIGGSMDKARFSAGAAIFWPWHAWVDDLYYCYQKDCAKGKSDLYIRDDDNDNGTEPSATNIVWVSPDIWVRNQADGYKNQTTETIKQTPGKKAYVYINSSLKKS